MLEKLTTLWPVVQKLLLVRYSVEYSCAIRVVRSTGLTILLAGAIYRKETKYI